VERAIKMAHEILERTDGTVFCLHEIVHNESVISHLRTKGMVFVESVCDIPFGGTVLISAHGTSPATIKEAEKRNLTVVDATCPFVLAGHAAIRRNFANGMRTVIIGNPMHAEVSGYLGEEGACLPQDVRCGERTGQVVQTTLDAEKFSSVCAATRDRQRAVRDFVGHVTNKGIPAASVGVVVVGSRKSSNTEKLSAVAESSGAKSWRVETHECIKDIDFSQIKVLGITSGASTPEDVFDAVCAVLKASV
jgi:4-hydroxy-3-methylbut-2-enyl diphosphate reductase